MATPSGKISLTKPEMDLLEARSFIDSYNQYQDRLVLLAQDAYRIGCNALKAAPTQDQCHLLYYGPLLTNLDLYRKCIAEQKLGQDRVIYEYFARLFSKYVISTNWTAISSNGCSP